MIVGQGQAHGLIAFQLPGIHPDTGGHVVDAENAGLRRVDNRGKGFNAERAEVGNRKGASLELVGADGALAAFIGQSLDLL